MKIKIGQVEIGISIVKYLTGTGFEVTVDAPIKDMGLSLFASYMPDAAETFVAKMGIGKVENEEKSAIS